jgi:soluble lytic murein transglycosylase
LIFAAATRTRSRRHASSRRLSRERTGKRKRRIAAVIAAAALGGGVALAVGGLGPIGDVVRELTLPLRHEDIIRQQSAEKGLDPALVAAVIYEESRFRDQTSHAGARGLMQITPATAEFIANDSGGVAFEQDDLATPQVNISYGTYYLRYLLRRYDGNETLAIAAYNAGETNVNRWVERAGGIEGFDAGEDIPFPETRHYVENVKQRKQDYRDRYSDELGL